MELILFGGLLAAMGLIIRRDDLVPLPEILMLLGCVVLLVGIFGG